MNIYRLLLMLFLLSGIDMYAVALGMPEEISNTHVGMPVLELIAARPRARLGVSKAPVDPEKIKVGKVVLMEELPSGGVFHTASYWLNDGKVIGIIMGGTCPPGQERKLRQQLMGDGVQRWGKRFSKIAKESNSPGAPQPLLTWDVEGTTIELQLPRNRARVEKRPNNFGLSFLPSSEVQKHPRKGVKMTEAERRVFLKGHDLDE